MIVRKSRKQNLGVCQFCGEPIKEIPCGWGCLNRSCGAFIYRDDHFFTTVLGRKVNCSSACALLKGETLYFHQVQIKDKTCDVSLSFGQKEDGNYKYGYFLNFLDNKRKEPPKERQVTGFDLLNGEY